MKKFTKFLSVMVLGLLLTGCGNKEKKEETKNSTSNKTEQISQKKEETKDISEEKVTLTLSEDGEEFKSLDLEVKKDVILQEVMEKELDVVTDKGMITSIEGHEQNEKENKFWMYEVNGEQPTVGAADFKLTPGDKVTWTLSTIEME